MAANRILTNFTSTMNETEQMCTRLNPNRTDFQGVHSFCERQDKLPASLCSVATVSVHFVTDRTIIALFHCLM